MLIHQTLRCLGELVLQVQCICSREGDVVPPNYPPASFPPLVFITQQYFWRSPPIHNRFHCFTIRFCQFGGSRDWGSVYGVRCKSLLPEKPPQAESDTWYRQHSSVQLCAHIFLSELKVLLNWHPSFYCVYAQFNLSLCGECAQP